MEKAKDITGKYVPTDKQIENWKKQYGDVFCYEADDFACYLRRPDRKAIGAAGVKGGDDFIKQGEVLIANAWLGGNDELRDEDRYFLGLQKHINGLVEVKTGELKKL